MENTVTITFDTIDAGRNFATALQLIQACGASPLQLANLQSAIPHIQYIVIKEGN